MNFQYEIIPDDQIDVCKDLCNELMAYQKSLSYIKRELFDTMNFETRLLPSVKNASSNYTILVKENDQKIGYVYSNVSPKEVYSNDFATFFDLSSVHNKTVGCLSQFYIKEGYRQYGIGSKLFDMSMQWLMKFDDVDDYFIYVSNGNNQALEFYKRKGFTISHEILDGFITVLRSNKHSILMKG
ncbi:GNAT family N-acetyltransferase [Bacillus salitolerans]|uniref:GNAT family N-acetyltransferase n=1 Tax=Bacillus salitolerans TaxID=1437434 RepID=A0ABW4LQF4_9BACI